MITTQLDFCVGHLPRHHTFACTRGAVPFSLWRLPFCSKLCEFFPWECPLLVPCLCPPFSLSPCFPFLGLLPSAYGASFVIFLKKVIFFLFPNTITFQGTKSRTFAYESRIGGCNSAHHRDTRDRDSMCQNKPQAVPSSRGL